MSSYIPRNEGPALEWMTAFSNGINSDPALYGLAASDADTIVAAVDLFATTRALTLVNSTRTPVAVQNKDNAYTAAVQVCRQYAIQIKYNAGIPDGAKVAIGVRPVNPTREPINVPATSPLLNIIAATPGAQTVRYSDSNTPDSPAKPFGAMGMQLYVAIKDTITDKESDAVFVGQYTKNPVAVAFDETDDGKMATYFARWVSRRGDVGPWSLPVSMRIAA